MGKVHGKSEERYTTGTYSGMELPEPIPRVRALRLLVRGCSRQECWDVRGSNEVADMNFYN